MCRRNKLAISSLRSDKRCPRAGRPRELRELRLGLGVAPEEQNESSRKEEQRGGLGNRIKRLKRDLVETAIAPPDIPRCNNAVCFRDRMRLPAEGWHQNVGAVEPRGKRGI